jgi:hypothetical protein
LNCGFGTKPDDYDLKELPPGRTEIPGVLTILGPGEFSYQFHLFVDDQGTREIVFTIHGTARASRGKAGSVN